MQSTPKNTRRILLMRHGKTLANQEHTTQGRLVNLGLIDEGKEQVRRLGRFLCSHSLSPDILVASPLVRAQESADILAPLCGLKNYETHAGLEEIDFGHLQGNTLEELKKQRVDWRAYYAGLDINIMYPGGESIRQARDRVVTTALELMTMYPTQNLGFVSHGGALRLLMSWILKTEHIQPIYHENSGLTTLEQSLDADLYFMIRTLNSTAHLHDPCYL